MRPYVLSDTCVVRCTLQMSIILLNLLVGPPLFRLALLRVGEAKASSIGGLLPVKAGPGGAAGHGHGHMGHKESGGGGGARGDGAGTAAELGALAHGLLVQDPQDKPDREV